MTIKLRYVETTPEGPVVKERIFEGHKNPEVLGNAFWKFMTLDGTPVFILPLGLTASLEFSDNTISLA